MVMFQGEIGLQHRQSEYGLVELHWGIFAGEWLRRAARVSDLSAIRARLVATLLAGETAWVLSPEDAILQSAVHTAVNHQMSMSPLRGLVDIALLARHYPVDWEAITQRARAWRVATPLWLVLSLAVDLAGLDEAAEAARQLRPSALRRRLIRRFASAESLVMMRDLSVSKWRYVFLLLLVDHGRDAAKLIFRALWPEREWLIARYGRCTFGRVCAISSTRRGATSNSRCAVHKWCTPTFAPTLTPLRCRDLMRAPSVPPTHHRELLLTQNLLECA
jgi:hypothetical protein